MGENLFRDLTAPLILDGATGTQLQKRGDLSLHLHFSGGGSQNTGDNL